MGVILSITYFIRCNTCFNGSRIAISIKNIEVFIIVTMGGHGGLNILHQKKWNVYNLDNRMKVEKDRREHR
jgi:hypothetical protein